AFVGHAMGDQRQDTGAYWWYALPSELPLTASRRQALAGRSGIDKVLRAAKWSEQTRSIIEATSAMMPVLDLFDMPSLPQWHSGRCVLIGDAAHAVSPHSGQGASLALEDAAELAAALQRHDRPEAAFADFEARRRRRTERVVAYGRKVGNQKRLGPIASKVQEWIMPMLLRAMPSNDWLYDRFG
ncbi:MAG: FAD-dependent monooxygenase, partial [Sphingomonas sp.]